MKISRSIIIAVVILALVIVVSFSLNNSDTPTGATTLSEAESVANCLREAGAKFYGSETCGHCKAQKDLFKEASLDRIYIGCSTPTGFSQECQEAGIEAVPTWIISGQKYVGEKSLEELKNLCQNS